MNEVPVFPDSSPPPGSLASPTPKGRHIPSAFVEVAQHTDGRWMWAACFNTAKCGTGYAPRAKWGRFAATRDAAVRAGLTELAATLDRFDHRDRQIEALRTWARSQLAPQQADLFA